MLKKVWSFLNRYKWWLLIVLIAAGVGYYLYTRDNKDQATVTFTTPEYRNIRQTLDISGQIEAEESAILSFPAASRLGWMGVSMGDKVNKWQAVATVDTRTLQKQLEVDLNNFAKQFITHDQTLADYDYYGNPDINLELKRILEKAQYDLDNTVVAVEIRDLAIKLSTLISPINGIVTHIDKPHSGVTVTPADTIHIVNPDTIYFEVIADEEDIGLVKLDQHAMINLDSFPGETYDGTVIFIDFTSNTTEGGGTGYIVKLSLPVNNADLKYKLGMNGEAEIILDEKTDVLSIPIDSLITREGTNYIDIQTDSGIQRIKITTGIADQEYIEVVDQIDPLTKILVPTANGQN